MRCTSIIAVTVAIIMAFSAQPAQAAPAALTASAETAWAPSSPEKAVPATTNRAPAKRAAPSWATNCAPGEANSEVTETTRQGAPNKQQCINGLKLSTRGFIQNRPGCLRNRPGPGFVYTSPYCGSKGLPVEYIGQARAIAYLNQNLPGSPAAPRVNADVQWEVKINGNRADILYYDRRNPTSVDIIEAKVSDNTDYPGWAQQLDGNYIQPLTAAGMPNVRRGQVLDRWGPYTDVFEVRDDRPKPYARCASGAPIIRTYTATTPSAGLLLITEDKGKRKCADNTDDPKLPLKDRLKYDNKDANPEDDPNKDTKKCPFDPVCLDEPIRFPSRVWADPHLATLDGLKYDLQSVGEFVLAESEQYDLEIQARFTPLGDNVSVIDRTAMLVSEHRVELGGDDPLIDGTPHAMADGDIVDLGNRSGVIRLGAVYYVVWGDGPVLRWEGRNASLGTYPNAGVALAGLLGNGDGDPENDLRTRDGAALPANASATVLHGDYADSWRIDDGESLFTYPAGKSTADYTDLSFPAQIITVHDLTSEQREIGSAACEEENVPAGPQFNACVLDIALTADTSFAKMAAQQKDVTLDPLAAGVNADGRLAVDFEHDPVPRNLLPDRISSDPSTTSFAGAFSGTAAYRFYVQSLPSHDGGTLAFDLLTLGDWDSDDDTEKVTVETDRGSPTTITPGSLSPAKTGTMASGLPFAVYRVTIPFEHTKSQVEFTIRATGVAGVSDQGVGIDDIQLDLGLVPPQRFDVALPLSVSAGRPGPGAGVLETAVSEDEYRFSLSRARSVYVQVGSCPGSSYLQWELLGPGGARVASGYCRGVETAELPAGDYRLVVRPQLEKAGEYSLTVTEIPADATATAVIGGSAELTTSSPGQNGAWTFTGIAGQRVFFDFSDGTFGAFSLTTVEVRAPDGTTLLPGILCGASCSFDAMTLPATGTYRIALDPGYAATGSLTMKLIEVPANVTTGVSIDAPESRLTTAGPGQNGTWTFAGTAGQRVTFAFTDGTFAHRYMARVTVRKPDGTVFLGPVYCGDTCALDTTTLPATGTYSIELDPEGSATGSLSLFLSGTDPAVTTVVDGPASRLTVRPGQNGTWSFAAAAGQKVAFGFTDSTWFAAFQAQVTVKKPDGTTLLGPQDCGANCAINSTVLPVAGTYTVVLDPDGAGSGSLTLTLTGADATASVTIGGATMKLTVKPGQQGLWTFSATAGQEVAFGFTDSTWFAAFQARVTVKKPDGTELVAPLDCGANCAINSTTMPTTGTYTVVLTPDDGGSGSLSLTLSAGDATATATIDGPPTPITLRPGQNGIWTFNATAGQKVAFGFTDSTWFAAFQARITVKKPDGTELVAPLDCGANCAINSTTMPTTGTYTVVLEPDKGDSGSLTLALRSA